MQARRHRDQYLFGAALLTPGRAGIQRGVRDALTKHTGNAEEERPWLLL